MSSDLWGTPRVLLDGQKSGGRFSVLSLSKLGAGIGRVCRGRPGWLVGCWWARLGALGARHTSLPCGSLLCHTWPVFVSPPGCELLASCGQELGLEYEAASVFSVSSLCSWGSHNLIIKLIFYLFWGRGQGPAMQFSLALNSLHSPRWPSTCSDPPSQPPECWDYSHAPPRLALVPFLAAAWLFQMPVRLQCLKDELGHMVSTALCPVCRAGLGPRPLP